MENRMVDSRPCEKGPHHFGFLLPLLVLPVVIGMMRGFARHKYGRMGNHSQEGWKNGVPPLFAELHRRAHAAEAQPPTTEV